MAIDHERLKTMYLDNINQGLRNLRDKEREKYKNRHKDDTTRFRVRPTQASIIVPLTPNYTLLAGSCNRASWFNNLDIPQTNPASPKGERRMDAGKAIEEQEHLYAANAPNMVTIGNNMALKTPLIDDVKINGEVDRLMQDQDGNIAVVEIKSFYGYDARKEIFGSKDKLGRPKYQHLLQVLVYLYMLKQNAIDVKYALIHYIDRSDFEEDVYIITWDVEGDEAYPNINGVQNRNIKLSGIIARYTQLALAVKNRTIPPRDCEFVYSERKILELADNGIISKNKMKKYLAGEIHPGDYQCSYCSWKNLCYGETPSDPKTWRTDADIQAILSGGKIQPAIIEETGWE